MTFKTLTDIQASEIALALLGINPHLKLYDPKDYETRLDIIENKSTVGAGQLGIKVDFGLAQKTRWGTEWSPSRYELYIGYYETVGEFNPGVICLSRVLDEVGEEVMTVEVLGNLALVTDKLREFGVW